MEDNARTKVYVVGGWYGEESPATIAVFSTRKKAKEFTKKCNKYRSFEIDEYIIDEPEPWLLDQSPRTATPPWPDPPPVSVADIEELREKIRRSEG